LHSPPKVEMMPSEKQARLDQLLDENNEGTISPEGKRELQVLVAEAARLMAENSKRVAEFVQSKSPVASQSAMPVTVWVKPQSSSG